MSCLLNTNMAHLPVGTNIFDPTVKTWIIAALSLSLVQNVLVNCFIIYKIVSINKAVTVNGGNFGRFGSTVQILVESGMIYSTTVFTYLITYAANSNAQYVMIDIVSFLAFRRSMVAQSLHSSTLSSGLSTVFLWSA
jgi:hypothetical protein